MSRDKRWRRTSPLAALFFLGQIIEFVAKNAVQSLAPLAALLFASEGTLGERLGIVGLAALTIPVIISVVTYLFFRYRITDDSVLIREGVFKKRQLDIKFDRIQAINTKQNFVYRWFDLVTVKFDTAGSAGQEGNLPAIKSALAESLKERIGRKKPALADADGEEEDESPPLLTLSNADMVKIGLSSNRSLIILAVLAPFAEQFETTIGERIVADFIADAAEESTLTVLQGAGLAVGIFFAIVLTLVTASVIGSFFRYHRFHLVADDSTFRSTGGLLTRHDHSINRSKVQSLEAKQNIVHMLFDRYYLRAKQASSADPTKSKHFVIPLCTDGQLHSLEDELLSAEFSDIQMAPRLAPFCRIERRYLWSRIMLAGLLPATAVTILLALLIGPWALICLLWVPLVSLFVWPMYRKYGFFINEDGVVLRRGLVGYRVSAFLHRKVQRITVTQSISQERRGLATIRFYLASGSLKLPYVDFDLAKRIRDFVLYRVESSNLAWH